MAAVSVADAGEIRGPILQRPGDRSVALAGLAVTVDAVHPKQEPAPGHRILAAVGNGADAAERLDTQARATRARDALTQRLLEALAVLGRTRVAVAAGDPAATRLQEFTSELDGDIAGYTEARREVEALSG